MNTDGLPQIRSGLIEENEKTMTKSRNQSSSPSRNTHLGFRNQTRSLRVASNNEDVLKMQDEWENLQQQLASLTSFNFDTDLYGASDKDSHNTSISANEDEEILESVGIEAPRSIPLITGHKSHFIDMPSADTDNDGVDGGIGFRKPQMIINREDKYQRRKLNQPLSSDRDDAFAAGKKMSDPSARTYVDIMREEALKREQEESNRESKKLIEEISFHEDSVVERVNEVVPEMVLIPLPIQKQQHMLVTSYATCIKSFKDNIGFLDATHLFDQIPLYVSKLPDWQGFVGIVVLLFIHSTVSFIDENNADNAASALMAGLAPNAKVLRDGKWGEQDAAILVPGDIINIKLRDIFSADARLLDGDPLSVDQSVLTGESLPVIELIVTYSVQHRKYRDRIDNLLVLLIGGIPIAMPIVLSVIMSIGSHKLSQQGEITKRVIADDEEDIAEVVHEELPPYKVDGAEENGRLKGLAVNFDEAPEDFTEDGDLGMVMWRHLVLQLHKIEEGLQDYAEFRHLPTKQFTDFSMVRKEIEDETNRMDGKSNQISLVPIHLSIHSTNVIPGLTKVVVEGQPESIVEDIGNLIHSYVDKPNCLILAITPANKDLATSDVVKDLNSNKLTGTLSPYMCSENMLQTLITLGNFLFGSIPESLESWESLNRIQMGDNFLNGLIVLWLTEIIGQARPPRCDEKPCTSATGGQFMFLFSSLALMAVGAGGIRPCSLVVAAIKVLGGGHRFVSIGLGNLNTTVLSVKFKQWDPGLVLEP